MNTFVSKFMLCDIYIVFNSFLLIILLKYNFGSFTYNLSVFLSFKYICVCVEFIPKFGFYRISSVFFFVVFNLRNLSYSYLLWLLIILILSVTSFYAFNLFSLFCFISFPLNWLNNFFFLWIKYYFFPYFSISVWKFYTFFTLWEASLKIIVCILTF